jgi:hypothetical protein
MVAVAFSKLLVSLYTSAIRHYATLYTTAAQALAGEAFHRADTDHSDSIGFQEFLQWARRYALLSSLREC